MGWRDEKPVDGIRKQACDIAEAVWCSLREQKVAGSIHHFNNIFFSQNYIVFAATC